MSAREKLRSALQAPAPLAAGALYNLALDALDHDLAEQIVVRVERALASGAESDHRLWQVLGLAHRDLQDSAAAHAAFSRAAALAPRDPLIAHSRARTALEAGIPASHLFSAARRLAPTDASVLLGQAAALLNERREDDAMALLASALAANPSWQDGHATYAKIAATSSSGQNPTTTIRSALARRPQEVALWGVLIRVLMEGEHYEQALEAAFAARASLGPSLEWTRIEAICLGETGRAEAAQALFDSLPLNDSAKVVAHPLRNLIRLKRFDAALRLAEQRLPGPDDMALWPYRALLWRITGDARWQWLEGDERLIASYDIGSAIGSIADLAEMLRGLHGAPRQPLDQSVRGGSQTDGHLFARAEPEIRRLRAAIADAVAQHIAQLPPALAGHPTLIERRAPLRFSGAWSVRLLDRGFHSDHVHPLGWLSSAFYVALPTAMDGADNQQAGWLTFGECRRLLPDLAGFKAIRPRIGQLVLFPSLTWHGTRPFDAGERMTVAFDIARPA